MLFGLPITLILSAILFLLLLALLMLLLFKQGEDRNLLKEYTATEKRDELIAVEDKSTRKFRLCHYLGRALKPKDDEIKNKFIAAGFFNFKYSYLYVPFKFISIALSSALFWYSGELFGLITMENQLIAIISSAIAIIFIPEMYLDYRAKKIVQHVSRQLPYALDLMGVCVQTGMTIEASISYLGHEMVAFDRITAHFLQQVDNRARLVGMEKALQEFYEQVPSQELHSFILTLTQSMHYGTSIYQVLTTLSKDIREVQLLTIEEKIGQMAAKISVPLIIFILLPLVVLIIGPSIMNLRIS